MSDIKQVIVIRKDLNMRKGKIAAQSSHACMKIFFDQLNPRFKKIEFKSTGLFGGTYQLLGDFEGWLIPNKPYFKEYINGAFKKICLYVNSEQELLSLYEQAKEKGIHTCLITDSGLTEFNGVATNTCIAIGPWDAKEIDEITGKLPLL